MSTIRPSGGHCVMHGNIAVSWRTYEVVIVWRRKVHRVRGCTPEVGEGSAGLPCWHLTFI